MDIDVSNVRLFALIPQAAQALFRLPKLRLLSPPREADCQLFLLRDHPDNNPIAFFNSW